MREWNFAKIRQGAIQQMRTIFESLRHQQHKLYTAFLVCIWGWQAWLSPPLSSRRDFRPLLWEHGEGWRIGQRD